MKFFVMIATVVFLSFAQACGSSDQPTSEVVPVVASTTEPAAVSVAVEAPLEIVDLKPHVDVTKLVDWSACQDAKDEAYERKQERCYALYEEKEELNYKLYIEFEKFRLVEADKFKAADLSAYYSWLELKERGEYDALMRLRLTSPAYALYEEVLEQHEYKCGKNEREEKYLSSAVIIEKIYREELEIIDTAKKKLLRQK